MLIAHKKEVGISIDVGEALAKYFNMKKSIIVFSLVLIFNAIHSQQLEINFDDGYLEWIKIDSILPNNLWQIGPPQKVLFDSAFSEPNVLITDTLNNYPVNNTSVFYVIFAWHSYLMWPQLGFKFKIDSDSISDVGYIEASYDNGNTWIEVIKDAPQYDIEWSVLGAELAGGNHEVIHSSGSDTIAFTGTSNTWYTFEMWMFGWDYNFPFNDTIIYRISFQSDSIQTNKEGWIIDNIWINDFFESIEETKYPLNELIAFPNPFRESLSFKTPDQNRFIKNLKIFDLGGKLIKEVYAISSEITLNLNYLKDGIYMYDAYDNVGEKYHGRMIKY